jgi:uncharacterized protein YkwD
MTTSVATATINSGPFANGRRMALAAVVLAASIGHADAGSLAGDAQAAISQYRNQHGQAAVKADARLMQLAREQARAMASAGVLDHDVGRSFSARIARYDPNTAAENIAAGTRDFPSTLSMWKRSPGHDANLLRSGVTRFGIASADAPRSRYKIFWSLIVAGPATDRGPGHRRAGRAGPAAMMGRCVAAECRF